MAIGLIEFIAIVIVFGLGGLMVYIIKRIYYDKDEPRNDDMIINCLSDYTDGYGILLKRKEEGNKELKRLLASPRDIDYIRLEEEDGEVREQEIFVKKELYVPFGISAHRKVYLALPDKPHQLPAELKEHPFGRMLMKYIDEQNVKEDKIEIQSLREKNLLKMTRKIRGLEMAEEIAEFYKDAAEDMVRSKAPQEELKKDG